MDTRSQQIAMETWLFPCSSMVEQEAVNFEVASSSLAGGAIFCWHKKLKKRDVDLALRARDESGRGTTHQT